MSESGVYEVRLDNGFRAFLVERRELPLVATVLWYRAGSRDERTGETGLAHFLEHMMFKGTDRYAKGQIDLLTAKLGGSNNAFTDHDGTAYHFSLASDRWETALEIEANRMKSCLFDPVEFDAERNVVLDELARGEDDPWNVLWQATEALAFQVHPYHHPVIGYAEDLRRVDAEGMRAFYRRHYGPNRAFLVVVGDIDRKRAAKRIQELFGGLEPVADRDPVLVEPVVRHERRGVVRAPGSLTRIAMACRTCRMGERDDFALDFLSHALGSSKSSRLHKRLVLDEEVATYVTTHNETRLDPGLFWILAELHAGVDVERVEGLIREELARICEDGVEVAEQRRARVQIRSSYLFEDETVLDTALKIGRFEALATEGHELLERVLPTYDEIDRRELREVARRYFGPEAWSVVWSLPEDAELRRPVVSPRKRKPAAGAKAKGKSSAAAGAPKSPARTTAKKPPGKAAKKPAKKAAKKAAARQARGKSADRLASAKPETKA
ncbi:MAG: M16 family metallopeptidase [Planctomycetota bacterium]|jgi:zinc protease